MAVHPLSGIPLAAIPSRDQQARPLSRSAAAIPDMAALPAQDAAEQARRIPGQAERVELERAAARLNALMAQKRIGIEFSIDDESGRTILRVIDADSGELLRQYPARHILAIARQIEQFTGLLVQTRA